MAKKNQKEIDLKEIKQRVCERHIDFYDKVLDDLEYILKNYSKELGYAETDFLEMPKNSIATLDFLISSIGKVQKGQRLALGLDENDFEDTTPVINIIEGLDESKI